MNMGLVKELSEYLSEAAPEATIRYGDYPRGEHTLKVTVILSQLNSVEKVREYYGRMPDLIHENERKQEKNETKLKELVDAATVIPSLFRGNGEF